MSTVSSIIVADSNQTLVEDLYYATLGRGPSSGELAYYTNLLATGLNSAQVAGDFLASAEYAARYGSNLSNVQYVTELYQNMLHRTPSSAELNYYVGQLGGAETRAQVLLNFVYSTEYQNDVAAQIHSAGIYAIGSIDQDGSSTQVNVTANGNPTDIAIAAPLATNITVQGSGHVTLDMFNSNYAALTSVTIANSGGVTAYLYNAPVLTSINAAQSSGTNVLSLGAGQSYVGGAGQSVIQLTADDSTTSINGGSSGHNEIVLAGVKFTAAGTGAHVSNFQIAGFNILSSAGAYDVSGDSASILSGITGVDIQQAMAVSTLFTVAQNSALTFDAGSVAAVTYQSIDKSGGSDAMTLTLNGGNAIGTLTLEDSASTPVGIGTINLVTNGGANSIATLDDNNLAALNVTGAGTVTIGAGAFTDDTAGSFSVSNLSGGLLSFKSFTDDALTNLTFTGKASTEIWAFNDTVSSSLTITDSDSSIVYLHSTANTAAATITITNSGSGLLVIGDISPLTAANLTSLTLSGLINFNMSGDSATSGTTVAAGSDNANVSISLAGAASGDTDNVTIGNGNDYVKISGAGTENITLGNGANIIDLTGSTAADNVVVGTGFNTVTLGNGGSAEHVSFGAHKPTAASYDQITLTNSNSSFTSATSSTATSVATGGLYVVSGLVAGDKIALPVANDALVAATNLAGATGQVDVAHGTYSASSSTFTYSATGHDTLITYDGLNNGSYALVSVVLTGFAYGSAISEAYNGIITLG